MRLSLTKHKYWNESIFAFYYYFDIITQQKYENTSQMVFIVVQKKCLQEGFRKTETNDKN